MSFGVTSSVSCPATITGELVSYTESDYAASTADSPDEWGNATERSYYGNGSIKEHEATYALGCDGSIGSVTLGSNGVESISITTSNGDWPQVTVKWYTGLPQCNGGCTFAVTVPSVEGKRKAQALGITASGGAVTGSSWSASASLNLLLDEGGDPVAYAFSGATIECSADGVGCTFSVGSDSDLEITSSSSSESNTAYDTCSASASGVIAGTAPSAS